MPSNPAPAPHRRSVFSVRQRACGEPQWFVDTGVTGVGRAAWCPDRARIRSHTRGADGVWPIAPIGEADLEQAIERARRVRLPSWVVMAPHEDAFAAVAARERREVMIDMMRRLVRQGIGVALTTRADLQDGEGLVRLAREVGDALTVRVGIFAADPTLGPKLEAKWEKGLAPSMRRLALARALREAGARVEVELGPIVPFANDDDKLLKDMVRAVARYGIDTIAPRWIEDAPGLDQQIEAEVSPSTARLVTGWFRQPGSSVGSATRRIIPLQVRKTRLVHIESAARAFGIKIASCACLAAGACVACLEAKAAPSEAQLDLFAS